MTYLEKPLRINKYPKRRKKKRPHTQWMNFDRVVCTWGEVPSLYYIWQLPIDDEGGKGWFACKKEKTYFEGFYLIHGEYFSKVFEVPFWEYGNGSVVLGYVAVIYKSNFGIHKGRFVFLKNAFSPGLEFSKAIAYKRSNQKAAMYFNDYKRKVSKGKVPVFETIMQVCNKLLLNGDSKAGGKMYRACEKLKKEFLNYKSNKEDYVRDVE